MSLRIADGPVITGIEDNVISELQSAAVEPVLLDHLRHNRCLRSSISAEQCHCGRQALIETDTSACQVLPAHKVLSSAVDSVPHPIITFTETKRVQEITNFRQAENGVGQACRIRIALLKTDFEVETFFRIKHRSKARTVHRQAQSRIIYQGITQELRRLVVGDDVVIEIVGQIQAPRAQCQPLLKYFGSEPG